ncbi:MAG: GlsB/YeaQ/YmgE family stress response membrane protein [Acidobacteria bacterium]|nr:GlsB/YeaQ/YmgE family stress response membrane protein [Acidobacteriota bacterium]
MLHILGQLIVGLIIGAVARLLLPGKEAIAAGPIGWLITALIGMGGSFLGTMIGRAIWKSENYAAGWIMSIAGAILLLVAYRMIF